MQLRCLIYSPRRTRRSRRFRASHDLNTTLASCGAEHNVVIVVYVVVNYHFGAAKIRYLVFQKFGMTHVSALFEHFRITDQLDPLPHDGFFDFFAGEYSGYILAALSNIFIADV